MSEKEKPIYDLESVYDKQISPLMAQVIAICKEHRMPMLATFQYQRTEERGEGFCTTMLPFSERVSSDKLAAAMSALAPRRARLSTITVIKADGTKEITMIADLDGG